MTNQLTTLASTITLAVALITSVVFAAEEHNHDHKTSSFQSVAVGLSALDSLISEVREKIGKGDFEGLHATSEELRGAAGGLEARLVDIAAANKERFKFNAEQLGTLASQLEEAHESKNKEEAEKVAKRLESVRDRLKAVAP